jgi:lipoprotein-anchoring transpeptidase ErfK/SrfK
MITRYIYALVAVASFLLGIGFYHLFIRTESATEGTRTDTKTETRIEWVKKDTLITRYITKEYPYIADPRPKDEEPKIIYDSLRTYNGNETVLYGNIRWTVVTGGHLKSLEMNPSLKIPVVHTVTTVRETTTVIREPGRLYATAELEGKSVSPGLAYSRKGFLAGYKYDISQRSHGFTLGVRIK